MPKIKFLPILLSVTLALVFFAFGRILVLLLGDAGLWLTIGLLAIFYALWGVGYRRRRGKK